MRILDEIRPRAFLNAIADGIVVLDADLRILYQNAAHEDLFGKHIGQKCCDTYKCDPVTCENCPIQTTLLDGGRHVSTRRISATQGERYVEVVASAVRNDLGHIIAGVALIRDVTERVRAEEERDRLLKREEEARAEAEEVVRKHNTFIAIASHELKTPFSSLWFQLQGLARTVSGESRIEFSAQRFAEQIEIANRQAARMARLIENLLSVSRITGGRFNLNLETVNLPDLVRESADRFSASLSLSECELRFDAPEPISCRCDRLRVDEIVTNLLSNAIRYGEHAPIDIVIRGEPTHVILSVSNHGESIAAADRERIFGEFDRGRSPDKRGGLGLGLYIAREIAIAHGGTITLEETVPQTTTFTVRLPREGPKMNEETATAADRAQDNP